MRLILLLTDPATASKVGPCLTATVVVGQTVLVFALVVRFDLPDAAAAATFDALVAEIAPTMVEAEPGTYVYNTHAVVDAPLSRIFYEVYRDRAALDEHEARPATAAFLAQLRALEPVIRVEAVAPDQW